jgi:hypothetical protein
MGTTLLGVGVSASNSRVFPIASTGEEQLIFTELRQTVSEIMARIIQRDPDTNSILASVAQGRQALRELKF